MGHVTNPYFGRVSRVWTRVDMGTRLNGNDVTKAEMKKTHFLFKHFYYRAVKIWIGHVTHMHLCDWSIFEMRPSDWLGPQPPPITTIEWLRFLVFIT